MRNSLFARILAVTLTLLLTITGTLFGIPARKCEAVGTHPFLIVSASEYAELQSRASQEPWASQRSTAIADAGSLTYDTSSSYVTRCTQMRDIMDSCSLAYILNPNGRTAYKSKILDTFKYWVSGQTGNLKNELNNLNWTYAVPPGSAFFSCVLALDIIYPDLSASELSTAESRLQAIGQWFYDNDMNWKGAQWGARGIWATYTNNTAKMQEAKQGYYDEFVRCTSDDGVNLTGTGYAQARFSADRNQKQYYMDVLTHTGQQNYYSDARVANFYEWFYGYASTAFKRLWVYGDTPYNNTYYTKSSIYKADNFSDNAGKYAAWIMDGESSPARGRLLNYVLHRTSFDAPERAKSRIFPDGGAFLFQDSSESTALGSVLWNAKRSDGHSHKEVNAINVAAYGELLLSNSGYNNWGTGWSEDGYDFTWNYINSMAVSGNTALIDYAFSEDDNPPTANDHQSKSGAGITEGFIAQYLNYASGDSGTALPNGKHIRNLVYVAPEGTKNGYWVLFDELDANTAGKTAHIALHPPTATYTTVSANTEYKWTVNKASGHDVYLTAFLGTAPASAQIKTGVTASYANSFLSKYLYATYNTDSTYGKKNIVTVLFPHDSSHAKASMARITGTGYSGASIALDSTTTDYALESAGTGDITYGGVTFNAGGTLYRKTGSNVTSYFVRSGKNFNDGGSSRKGFSSSQAVSLYVKGTAGNIVSPETNVTFYYPDINGVKLNGASATVSNSGSGWVTVSVPAGTYAVELTTGSTPPPPAGWYGKAAFTDGSHSLGTGNTGRLTVEYDVTPLYGSLNACTGYADSSTVIDTWSDPAMTIRMNTSGYFDVRNGGAYQALTNVAYTANSTYHVKMVTDLNSKIYDVWVTPSGGSEIQIADDYAFRLDAPAIDDLGQVNLKDDQDDRYRIENHTVTPASVSPPQTFIPGHDAYVRDGSYASDNYGTLSGLVVKSDAAGYARKAYLKFDFSTLSASSVTRAVLRVNTLSVGTDASRIIKVYGNANESWLESTITWNNAPAASTYITSIDVGNTANTWYEADVTSYVNSHMSDKVVSFELINEGAISSQGIVTFSSSETASNKPQLVIQP